MKFLKYAAMVVALTCFANPTMAQEPVEGDKPSLTDVANGADKASGDEAADKEAKEVVEKAAEVIAGGTVAPAADATEGEFEVAEGFSLIQQIFNHVQDGKHKGSAEGKGVLAGLIIMLFVWVGRFNLSFGSKSFSLLGFLPKNAVPWVTMGLACVSSLGTSLAFGSVHWGEATYTAFLSGASAIALWESVFKHVLKKKPAGDEATA